LELLRKTQSICPECFKVLDAEVFVDDDNKVKIRKTCDEHGYFEDVYWSSYEKYQQAMKYYTEGTKLENPRTQTVKGCPYDCGICPNHKSSTMLAIIDLTNRCNLNCPICFANANNPDVPYIYEVSTQQVKNMIDNLASNKPIPPSALQFSGGEPTLRDDLPELIQYASEKGINHVEVNTNGLRLSRDLAYFERLRDADMNTLYLSFEGLTAEPYVKSRGIDLHELKFKVVENSRKIGFDSIMLVPTIARGVNEDQLGDIIRYAAKNHDVMSGVNGQPISLAGRVTTKERRKLRITIPEITRLIEEQTDGQIKQTDFYPVPFVASVARAIGVIRGRVYPDFSVHPCCGVGTFVFAEGDKIVPINRYINVEKFVRSLSNVVRYSSGGKVGIRAKWELLKSLRHVKLSILRELISDLYKKGTYPSIAKIMHKMIMVGMMHFMDAYNFDLQRAQMCAIHYALPDGRIVPFCTYNTIHRANFEAKFGTPKAKLPLILQGAKAGSSPVP